MTAFPSSIVFGRDETRKPHASVFLLPEVEAAESAARLMGMHSYRIEPGEVRLTVRDESGFERLCTNRGRAY